MSIKTFIRENVINILKKGGQFSLYLLHCTLQTLIIMSKKKYCDNYSCKSLWKNCIVSKKIIPTNYCTEIEAAMPIQYILFR